MSFYDKYFGKQTLDANGTTIEVHDGYLSCPTLKGFKLVDVIPEIKGTTALIQNLSKLVSVAQQGIINYRYVNGLELSCQLVPKYTATILYVDIFIVEGHRAKIRIQDNTNYTATTAAQCLAKLLQYEEKCASWYR
jgi:hypothetical protein